MQAEFEKLPEIKKRLISVKFNEVLNRYESKNSTLIECLEVVIFLNGAWMAYQEQQKRIDELEAYKNQLLDDLDGVTHTLD